MVRFYDPIDKNDLERVSGILSRSGIEYSLRPEPATELGPGQIHVAEEDLPRAEKLLLKGRH